jgi:hypothetical protein
MVVDDDDREISREATRSEPRTASSGIGGRGADASRAGAIA